LTPLTDRDCATPLATSGKRAPPFDCPRTGAFKATINATTEIHLTVMHPLSWVLPADPCFLLSQLVELLQHLIRSLHHSRVGFIGPLRENHGHKLVHHTDVRLFQLALQQGSQSL